MAIVKQWPQAPVSVDRSSLYLSCPLQAPLRLRFPCDRPDALMPCTTRYRCFPQYDVDQADSRPMSSYLAPRGSFGKVSRADEVVGASCDGIP